MPIFEFACKDCDNTFEILVLNPSEEIQCPECTSNELEKLISAHSVGGSHVEPGCATPACGMDPSTCHACQ